ncbi:hypothetical protein CXB45_01305 [Corynebacterium mastitidis]|uniref:Uncharacterized protein n=2 Tax=Corynebacterium mastitidis TaxID=161890 RepID=A0A2N0X9Y3_9CORY|nr:hypothetical protein CXB45_01305 [Corynebacterium mastitidis]
MLVVSAGVLTAGFARGNLISFAVVPAITIISCVIVRTARKKTLFSSAGLEFPELVAVACGAVALVCFSCSMALAETEPSRISQYAISFFCAALLFTLLGDRQER